MTQQNDPWQDFSNWQQQMYDPNSLWGQLFQRMSKIHDMQNQTWGQQSQQDSSNSYNPFGKWGDFTRNNRSY
jgi:hypothetical protein